MKCTSCESGKLLPSYLEGMIPCHTCDNCGGNLLSLGDYLKWREQNENVEFVSDTTSEVIADSDADESTGALICPKTGRLMTKYRISKDTDHRLDLSPSINAVWMDRGEWELLKQNGLAGKVNNIFTDHWQREVHSDASAEVLAAMYQRKFGDSYNDIKAFRASLDQMEDKSEVIAYLIADDPYSP